MSLSEYLDKRPAGNQGSVPSSTTRRAPQLDVHPEILEQIERYNSGEDKPAGMGAVPDMSKLQASTQMDTRGLCWGWDCPEDLRKFLGIVWRDWVPASRCDFCIYEAAGCYCDVYFCRLHEGLVV